MCSLEQTDTVTSMKALLKLAEGSQLSSRLDGTLSHGHRDWMELHQVRRFPQYITSASQTPLIGWCTCCLSSLLMTKSRVCHPVEALPICI